MEPIQLAITAAKEVGDQVVEGFLESSGANTLEQAGILLRVSAVAAQSDILRAGILKLLGDDLDSAIYYLKGTSWEGFLRPEVEDSVANLRDSIRAKKAA